jgi:multidrug efflux pump subunit AcrA (membrane-fusion protein)
MMNLIIAGGVAGGLLLLCGGLLLCARSQSKKETENAEKAEDVEEAQAKQADVTTAQTQLAKEEARRAKAEAAAARVAEREAAAEAERQAAAEREAAEAARRAKETCVDGVCTDGELKGALVLNQPLERKIIGPIKMTTDVDAVAQKLDENKDKAKNEKFKMGEPDMLIDEKGEARNIQGVMTTDKGTTIVGTKKLTYNPNAAAKTLQAAANMIKSGPAKVDLSKGKTIDYAALALMQAEKPTNVKPFSVGRREQNLS